MGSSKALVPAGQAACLILVDSRERRPLPLPKVLVKRAAPGRLPSWSPARPLPVQVARRTLPTADYFLAELPGTLYFHANSAVIETKRSLSELAGNCINPDGRRRFRDCLARMRREFWAPLLVVEGGLNTLYTSRPCDPVPHPELVIDHLIRMLLESGVPFLCVPTSTDRQRRQLGDFVVRWLVNAAIAPRPQQGEMLDSTA